MQKKDLINLIEKKYPLSLAEPWDKCGFICDNNKINDIKNILICLDVTNDVVNYAISNNIHFIISHHPIFINSDKIVLTLLEKKLINKIKKNKILFYSLHTNFDNNNYGMNPYILKKIKCLNIKKIKGVFVAEFKKTMKYKKICNIFKKKFNLKNIGYSKNFISNKSKKIAFIAGSGFGVLKENIDYFKNNVDLIITGDIKWHDWILSENYKLPTLDVGHKIENVFIDIIYDFLIKNDLNIFKFKSKNKINY